MKTVHAVSRREPHKQTLSGLAVGGLLVLISLIDMVVLKKPIFTHHMVYVLLVPGTALFLRAWRPPIGKLRTALLLVGGVLVGAVPAALVGGSAPLLRLGLAAGVVGAAMLGFGFSEKPAQR